MSLDSAVIWKATRSTETLQEAKAFGVAEDLFVGAGKVAWRFIHTYRDEHGSIPSPGIIGENSGLALSPLTEDDDGAMTYFVDKLHERAIFRALKYGVDKTYEYIEEGEQEEAASEIIKLADHLRDRKAARVRVRDLSQIVPEVKEMYERTKRGEIGIPFPWDTMNEMTLGMWPGTLTFFTARPGVGKTWTAINICHHVWQKGYKVLVVSPEMIGVELAERVVGLHGKLSYSDLVSGRLGDFGGEKALDDTIAELSQREGFHVLDDEERLSSQYIEEAVEAVDPDLIAVDSVYMLKVFQGKVKQGVGSKGGRYDRILETIDWLRSFSRRTKKPVLAISQLSRDAKMKKGEAERLKQGVGTGGLEDAVAMSDTLLMDAHNLFAMFQDDDMRLDKQMLYVPLKARRQAAWSSVVTRWDMESMNFDQIGTKVESEGDFRDKSFDDVTF